MVPKAPWVLNRVRFSKKKIHEKRFNKKWRTPSERARQDLFSGIGCLSKFLSEHNKKLGESFCTFDLNLPRDFEIENFVSEPTEIL